MKGLRPELKPDSVEKPMKVGIDLIYEGIETLGFAGSAQSSGKVGIDLIYEGIETLIR